LGNADDSLQAARVLRHEARRSEGWRLTAATLVVTGTDTGVGKTVVAAALLRQAGALGWRTAGYKPVASGCERVGAACHNADALALQAAATEPLPYARVNPYAFEPAIAPHLAAEAAGDRVRLSVLNEGHAYLAARADLVVLEGAGGWLVPLNPDISFGGWVAQQGWPVLLVVGMRLGCINHALLSAESIARRCRLVGWVPNGLAERMPAYAETLAALQTRLPAPCWGEIPPGRPEAARWSTPALQALQALRRGSADEA
jgi:dethiobiotin synthetase